jgi:hypothetical protein
MLRPINSTLKTAASTIGQPRRSRQKSLADTDRLLAVDDDPRQTLRAAIQIDAVGATEILDDELAGLIAKQMEVFSRHIGIVDDDVVVVAASDPCLLSGQAEARGDFMLTRKNLDPDHLAT